MKGCTYVIHVASPYPCQIVPNEDDVVKPAVDGMNTILKACQKEKISRMVVTSALSAVMGMYVTIIWVDIKVHSQLL